MNWIRRHRAALLVMIGIAAYTVFFSWYSIARANNFNSGWYDAGIMTQTVWNVGHGQGFTFTNPEAGPGGVHGQRMLRSSIHTDFMLAVLSPLSWLSGYTLEALLITQTLVLAAGAWFVWLIARRLWQRDWLAVAAAWVYLLYPPLHAANLFDVHSVVFSVTFFLAAAEAVLAGRRRIFWLWVALALITKEQVGITLGLLGGYLWWRRGERRRAWAALLIPWAWSLLMIFAIIPLSRPGQSGHFIFDKFYDSTSQGQASDGLGLHAVVELANHPRLIWHRLVNRTHIQSATQLLTPLGGVIPLLSPVTYLMAPEVLIYWLWDTPNPQTLLFHYHALFIPFLVLGWLLSWDSVERLVSTKWPSRRRWATYALIGLTLAGLAYATWKYSSWPWSPVHRWRLVAWQERLRPKIDEGLRLIPDGASVALTQNLGAHLAERAEVQIVPNGIQHVDYIVILQRSFAATTRTDGKRVAERVMLEELLAWIDRSKAYERVYTADRFMIFRRIATPTEPEPVWPRPILGRD